MLLELSPPCTKPIPYLSNSFAVIRPRNPGVRGNDLTVALAEADLVVPTGACLFLVDLSSRPPPSVVLAPMSLAPLVLICSVLEVSVGDVEKVPKASDLVISEGAVLQDTVSEEKSNRN